MKNSLIFVLLFVSTIVLSLFLPWWIIAPLALAFAFFFRLSGLAGFLVSFFSVAVAWILSIYWIDTGAVSELMGKLFEVEGFLTPLISGLVGGLIAGVFGWAGALLAPRRR